jgi:phospholipid transport system substrate-binding protein
VQNAAQGMLGDLDKDRDAYHRDPTKVGQLVDKYLLPHFDTEGSARLVLGAHWRTATPEQRKRFVDAFYHSLLTNYGSALVDFTADRLKIFPTKVDPDATRATVRTEVKRANGDRVAVNYYLHKTPQGWKAWDVVIDGISYVNSYRTDFGEQIEAQGIESVIKRLEAGEKPGAIGKQTGGKSG